MGVWQAHVWRELHNLDAVAENVLSLLLILLASGSGGKQNTGSEHIHQLVGSGGPSDTLVSQTM